MTTKTHKVSTSLAVLLIFQFNTSSSMILYPYCVGRLGYLGAAFALIFWWSFVIYIEILVSRAYCRAAVAHPKAETLGDLGEAIYGKLGRMLLEIFQQANMWLWLPVATVFIADSIRSVVLTAFGTSSDNLRGGFNCHLTWLGITLAFELVLVQFIENFREAGWLAIVSLIFIVAKLGLFALDGVMERRAHGPLEDQMQPRLFGHSAAPTAATDEAMWVEVLNALTILSYSFLPIFIHVELQSEMQKPQEYEKALLIAVTMTALAYLGAGYIAVSLGGWDTTYPITKAPDRPLQYGMSYPPASIPTNIFVIYATLLDYVIAHLAIAKNLLSKSFTSMPSTSGELTTHQHEIASWLHRRFRWLLCSIGPWLLNAALALAVPIFSSLVSFLTGLTGPSTQIVIPALILLLASVRHDDVVDDNENENDDDNKHKTSTTRWCYHTSLIVCMIFGIAACAVALTAAAGGLSMIRFINHGDGTRNFFCS